MGTGYFRGLCFPSSKRQSVLNYHGLHQDSGFFCVQCTALTDDNKCEHSSMTHEWSNALSHILIPHLQDILACRLMSESLNNSLQEMIENSISGKDCYDDLHTTLILECFFFAFVCTWKKKKRKTKQKNSHSNIQTHIKDGGEQPTNLFNL